MFAAQSGNLSALLRAMTSGSWEDLLWAHCRALVESRVDATLRTKIDCGPRADTLVSDSALLSSKFLRVLLS